jgi:hypothetical protein
MCKGAVHARWKPKLAIGARGRSVDDDRRLIGPRHEVSAAYGRRGNRETTRHCFATT